MKIIIGLTGNKGSGKNTAHTFIEGYYFGKKRVEEIALAGPLKRSCAEVLNLEPRLFVDQNLKEVDLPIPVQLDKKIIEQFFKQFGRADYDFNEHVRPHLGKILHTPRQILQYVGTEVLRALDEDIHCKAAVAQVGECDIAVVTDIRFPNELNFFLNLQNVDFVPVYIENRRAEEAASADKHASEAHIGFIKTKCDVIPNNDTITNFQWAVALYLGDKIDPKLEL